jgi:hypothetical protein
MIMSNIGWKSTATPHRTTNDKFWSTGHLGHWFLNVPIDGCDLWKGGVTPSRFGVLGAFITHHHIGAFTLA